MNGFKRGQVVVKEENKDVKKIVTENLFTNEGLQPSYKDLDQIFENPDYTSSDEAVSTYFLSIKIMIRYRISILPINWHFK